MSGRPLAADRRRSALALKLSGASYRQIADALGFSSPVSAENAVLAEMGQRVTVEQRDRARELEGARIERLLQAVWAKAIDTHEPQQLAAVREARGLMERYARLFGLDAPQMIQVTTPTTAELENWIAGVLAAGVPDVVEAEVIDMEDYQLEGEVDAG